MSTYNADKFLAQNEIAAHTLTPEQVAPYAQHHAGGLYVLFDYVEGSEGLCVKMHDSWGEHPDKVVVHVYDPEDDGGPNEVVEYHTTGRAAFQRFLEIADAGDLPGDAEPTQGQGERTYAIGLPVAITVRDNGTVTFDFDLSEATDINEDEDAAHRFDDFLSDDIERVSVATAKVGNNISITL